MSEVKALEKLRTAARNMAKGRNLENHEECNLLLIIADEIEREHNQRVAELNGAVCERDGRIGAYERRNTELNDALKAICRRFGVSTEWSAEDAAKKVLEALERDYMELPVDAEGVPIRIGDLLVLQHEVKEKPSEVESITFDGQDWYFTSSDGFLNAAGFSHVKPRTLESVLADLTNEVWEASCTCQTTWSDSGLDGIEKRYADEIRSLIGGEDA